MLQAFPLEQLSTNSFFWGFRYICKCSSTSFRQVRCSWPQKTLQRNRRRNNITTYSAGTGILVEVKQEYTSTIIQRFFSNTGKEAIRVTLVITISSSLTLHNTNLHPPYLPLAFPFPCFIKEGLPGVWTQDPESLSQKHFTHGAACLAYPLFSSSQGWDMTKL